MSALSDSYEEEYEFSYSGKNLFESGRPGYDWCPLFGELPTIFESRKKHQVADRCVDIIIAARGLWEIPFPYSLNGLIRTPEHLALSNPNWPDIDEVPGFQSAILAARSIVLWNHSRIVSNALDYCRNTQSPYPYHWYENNAGIMHYVRSSMNHFAYPSGVLSERCPLLMYPPGSPEEAALKQYEHLRDVQDEAQNVPDYLVFSALAIAEAWGILSEVLYYGQRENSTDVRRDLNTAEKLLEKAYWLRIASDKKNIEETADEAANAVERHEKDRLEKAQKGIDERKMEIRAAAVSEAQDILRKSEKPLRKWTVVNEIAKRIDNRNAINEFLLQEEPGSGAIERYIRHLFPPAK
jgi:hypothetical protein